VAKLIKCPRCQAKIDVTDLSAGSTVRCTDCGAMVRIPTGNTGKHAAVPGAVPPPPPPAPAPQAAGKDRPTKKRAMGGRQTNLFRKMSNVKAPGDKRPRGDSDRGAAGKSGNTNLVIGGVVGGILLIGVVAYAMMGGKSDKHTAKSDPAESSERKKKPASTNSNTSRPPEKSSFSPGAAPSVPAGTFQPGARGLVDTSMPNLNSLLRDEALKREYEALITGGKASEVVAQDHRWILVAFDGILSDNEAVARGSMEVIHDIIVKRGFAKDVEQYTKLATQSKMPGFEIASARTEEYQYWARWWFTRSSQDMVAKWATDSGATFNPAPAAKSVSAPAGAGEWEQIMTGLRSGGGYHNQNSPEYPYFQHVKGMGKAAYPNIIKYIDHEDPAMGKAAVSLLCELTGHESERRVNESNKAAIKADWDAWLKTQ
jgi:hypothetical protein